MDAVLGSGVRLGDTVYVMGPGEEAPDVMEIHSAGETADQAHPAGAVTAILPEAPVAATSAEAGSSV
jgi:hypothetical protein